MTGSVLPAVDLHFPESSVLPFSVHNHGIKKNGWTAVVLHPFQLQIHLCLEVLLLEEQVVQQAQSEHVL